MDDVHSTISSCQLAVMSDVVNAPLLSMLSRVYLPVTSRVISDIKIERHSVERIPPPKPLMSQNCYCQLSSKRPVTPMIYILEYIMSLGDTVILPRRVEHGGTDAPPYRLTVVRSPHSVNNRTVDQLPLTTSHPPLGCRAFIACTNLRYAFWVTMHL